MIRPLLAVVVAVLLLVVPVHAVTDYGASEVTRLWRAADDAPLCTAAYIFPRPSETTAWLLSAGHCAVLGVTAARRSTSDAVSALVDWRVVLLGDPRYTADFLDVALGTVPETRPAPRYLWLADRSPEQGERVWIHGFPAMIERVIPALVVGRRGRVLIVETEPGEVAPGASGSPVVDRFGRVVGVLWGLQFGGGATRDIVLVTPVEEILAAMALVGVKR